MSTVPSPVISSSDLNTDAITQATGPAKEGSDLQDVKFYNPFDGTKGRLGGVYLDVVERVTAEEQRAKSEKRKPNLSNAPAVAGTPLVTEAQRFNNDFANSTTTVAPVKEVDPVSTLKVDYGTAKNETEEDPEKDPEPETPNGPGNPETTTVQV